MEKKDLIEFLEFRRKFSRTEWQDINFMVDQRLSQKAANLEIDDFDIEIILDYCKHSMSFKSLWSE